MPCLPPPAPPPPPPAPALVTVDLIEGGTARFSPLAFVAVVDGTGGQCTLHLTGIRKWQVQGTGVEIEQRVRRALRAWER